MEFWFSELHSPHVKFDIRVEKQLFSGESDYQRIDVFQSPEFGKFLTLNGSVIFSEQDCFIYNEMVVHVPMSVHPDVKNVLIIGGGDGGVSPGGGLRHRQHGDERPDAAGGGRGALQCVPARSHHL